MDTVKSTNNLELSKEFYNEAFYQTIEILMKDYGSAIYRDLCFLLRQLTLSRISYQRLVMRDLMRDCNMNIYLEVDLDPYQALDLFIARPRCTQHNSRIFSFITSDWNLRFGNKIKPQLAKLEQANTKLFMYQTQKLYSIIESAYQIKMNHEGSFKLPEATIYELSADLQDTGSLDYAITQLTGAEVYKNHCQTLIKNLNTKLSMEDQQQLKELLRSIERLEEINTLQIIQAIKVSTNEEIKRQFGSQYGCDIDLQYKYMNLSQDLSSHRTIGANQRCSFKTEMKLFESNEEI